MLERQDPIGTRTSDAEHTMLVGFDATSESRAALRAAVERAGPEDAIAVVHAYPQVSVWMGAPYYDQAVRRTLHEARRVLDKARDIADAAAAPVTLEMFEGAPADVLARIARLRDVDEIVVGARPLGRVQTLLHSVSRRILRRADRPVLVVTTG